MKEWLTQTDPSPCLLGVVAAVVAAAAVVIARLAGLGATVHTFKRHVRGKKSLFFSYLIFPIQSHVVHGRSELVRQQHGFHEKQFFNKSLLC